MQINTEKDLCKNEILRITQDILRFVEVDEQKIDSIREPIRVAIDRHCYNIKSNNHNVLVFSDRRKAIALLENKQVALIKSQKSVSWQNNSFEQHVDLFLKNEQSLVEISYQVDSLDSLVNQRDGLSQYISSNHSSLGELLRKEVNSTIRQNLKEKALGQFSLPFETAFIKNTQTGRIHFAIKNHKSYEDLALTQEQIFTNQLEKCRCSVRIDWCEWELLKNSADQTFNFSEKEILIFNKGHSHKSYFDQYNNQTHLFFFLLVSSFTKHIQHWMNLYHKITVDEFLSHFDRNILDACCSTSVAGEAWNWIQSSESDQSRLYRIQALQAYPKLFNICLEQEYLLKNLQVGAFDRDETPSLSKITQKVDAGQKLEIVLSEELRLNTNLVASLERVMVPDNMFQFLYKYITTINSKWPTDYFPKGELLVRQAQWTVILDILEFIESLNTSDQDIEDTENKERTYQHIEKQKNIWKLPKFYSQYLNIPPRSYYQHPILFCDDGIKDMIQKFTINVIAPFFINEFLPRDSSITLGEYQNKFKDKFEAFAFGILLEGRSATDLMRTSQEWHRRIRHREPRLAAISGRRSSVWPPLCSHVEINGFKLTCLTSSRDLSDEGDCLGHCVGGYDEYCRVERSHIISLRTASNQSLSTLEVQANLTHDEDGSPKWSLEIKQHRAYANVDPSSEETKAAKQFVAKINAGKISVDWNFLEEERIKRLEAVNLNTIESVIGYDPWNSELRDAALEAWQFALPASLKGFDWNQIIKKIGYESRFNGVQEDLDQSNATLSV